MSKIWWLQHADFQALAEQDRHRLLQLMHEARYEADKTVYSCTLPGDVIYLIQQGRVNLYQQTPADTRRKLVGLGPGDLFGSLGLMEEGYKKGFAVTLTETRMLVLRRQAFERLMTFYPETGARVIGHFQKTHHDVLDLHTRLNARHTATRLYRLLLHHLENPAYTLGGQALPFPLDTRLMGEQLGCRPEVVQVCLRELSEQGLIRCEDEQIELLNRAALKKKWRKKTQRI